MLITPPSVEDGANAIYGLKFWEVWVDPPAICKEFIKLNGMEVLDFLIEQVQD